MKKTLIAFLFVISGLAAQSRMVQPHAAQHFSSDAVPVGHRIDFDFFVARLPDDSSGNKMGGLQLTASSGGTTHPVWFEGVFENGEMLLWSGRAPLLASWPAGTTPAARLSCRMASANTSANVKFRFHVMAVSPGSAQNVGVATFGGTNDTADIAVPDAAGHPFEVSLVLTDLDDMAAGDFFVTAIERRTASSADASGDVLCMTYSWTWTVPQ